MAAAQISLSPNLGETKPMTKTRGILLETMQLVEPKKSVHVPNHLLETKIYSKIAQNNVVQARPAVLHFGGFELGRTQTAVLRLVNVSTEVQRMHVIPPQSKYFYIRYTKNERLVPGLSLDCTIEFTPDEWRYYYDCVRIHTKDEENLVIPIHAYPVMSADDFPSRLDFSPVPVGHRSVKKIPLRCNVPIDFEFQLTFLQPHPAFTVEPLAGIVPANGEIEVSVAFTPSEFSTAHMKLQLLISQFNAKPLICAITGSSAPGLAKEITEAAFEEQDVSTLDPRCITPVERARKKRKEKMSPRPATQPQPQEIEYAGIKFPTNLDTPYSVAQVLLQEPGKLRMKDIREAVLARKADGVGSTRQMKEAMFEMAVRKDVYEERQNQLRWQVKLGEDQITAAAREEILESREDAWQEYKRKRGDPAVEEESRRTRTSCTFRRTTRDVSKLGESGVKFDLYTNDMWAVRHAALRRFQQAARKIIVRRRAERNIRGLRDTILDWGKRKFATISSAALKEKSGMDAEAEAEDEVLLEPERVKSITFPMYAPPNVKDDMAVDALGVVPFKPTAVGVKEKVPYFGLKVPNQYRLMEYEDHNTHVASTSYVPPNLVRQLRTGAEDEIINLPPPVMSSISAENVNEGDLVVEDVAMDTAAAAEVLSLIPPAAMFKPLEYPPLHIFNPAPGLQVFQPPLPYGETDSDFHLCPLPRYTSPETGNPHTTTQRKYLDRERKSIQLDREDVIKGVMAWKRFTSQGLTSLSNTPTLTNVWVPRWKDPFSDDLLPGDVPPLYDMLPEEDKANIDADEEEDGDDESLMLSPEMVMAQFPVMEADMQQQQTEEKATKKEDNFPHGNKMPATNIPVSSTGPVPRERREQELEFFMQKKYNRLGNKFQSRIKTLDSLKTDPDLVLK